MGKNIKAPFNIKMADIFVLNDLGITEVIAGYSGSGDSGQIDDINYYNDEGKNIKDIPNEIHQNIEKQFYKQLDYTDDWYNNEGGYGTITFDLVSLSIEILENIRVTSTDVTNYSNIVKITE